MKKIAYLLVICFSLVLFGCTQSDDNLEKTIEIINDISIIYVEGDSHTSVTKNIILPTESKISPSAIIKWSSSDENSCTNKGVIKRTASDKQVTLTLSVSYLDEQQTKEILITIKKASEPEIIGAKDLTYMLGSTAEINFLDGVFAYDCEGNRIAEILVDYSEVVLTKVGVYSVRYSVTDKNGLSTILVTSLKVINQSPEISGVSEIIHYKGDSKPDYLLAVSAFDQEGNDITRSIVVDDSLVDLETIGTYEIIYSVTSLGVQVTRSTSLIVIEKGAPVITGTHDIVYYITDDAPNYLEGISAYDPSGNDITSSIHVDYSEVDLTLPGDYQIEYSVTYYGTQTSIVLNVKVIEKGKPTISGIQDITYYIGDGSPNYKAGVTSQDPMGNDISNMLEVDDSLVDLTIKGVYQVLYFVVFDRIRVEVQATVTVEEKTPPIITGAQNLVYHLGSPEIDYLSYVSAVNYLGIDISRKVRVDNSQVKLTEIGLYSLVYYVSDEGLYSEAIVTVLVREVPIYITISFDTNGGISVQDKIIEKGMGMFELPSSSKDGFRFSGWYLDEFLENKYNIGDIFNESMTLYAKWDQVFVLSFDLNKAKGTAPLSFLGTASETTIIPGASGITSFKKDFKEWNTSPLGDGNAFLPGDLFVITADLVLYAIFIDQEGYISYHETFERSGISSTYDSGIYVGDDASFAFIYARNQGSGTTDYAIDGKGIMLGGVNGNNHSILEIALDASNLVLFSFEYRKAYTGSTVREYQVEIISQNGTIQYQLDLFGNTSGIDSEVHLFEALLEGISGEIVIRISAVSGTQMTVDNIIWIDTQE